MSDILFKEGLLIGVDSYENDGDNSQTHFISGLSERSVRFYEELLEAVGTNDFIDEEELCETVASILKKHPNISNDIKQEWYLEGIDTEGLAENYHYLITEALGRPGEGYDYGFIRQFDGLKVYAVPRPIKEIKL